MVLLGVLHTHTTFWLVCGHGDVVFKHISGSCPLTAFTRMHILHPAQTINIIPCIQYIEQPHIYYIVSYIRHGKIVANSENNSPQPISSVYSTTPSNLCICICVCIQCNSFFHQFYHQKQRWQQQKQLRPLPLLSNRNKKKIINAHRALHIVQYIHARCPDRNLCTQY